MPGGSVDVVVRFLGDSSKLRDETDKVEGTGGKLKKWAGGAAAALGGAFAIGKVTEFVGAAEEANAVQAKLTKTLENAGDATGQYAKHADELASSLQSKTGIDDEVIKGGQTILATFHSVSDAAGQQSGAFDRATKAALDMSSAGFGSVESASTMLGKALEDPEKGITALGKAGVTFSDDQKAAIKAFLDSGDKAGAMGIILDNVEGQVGGVAEASATAGDKMSVAFGETEEAVGQALLPAFEALAPILQTVARFVQENSTWLVPLIAAVAAITIGVWAWNAALAANPIILVTLAIAALVAGLVLAYQNVDWFRAIVDTMAAAVVTAFQWLWGVIQTVFDGLKTGFDFVMGIFQTFLGVVQSVFGWIADHWQLLLAILTGPFGIAVGLIASNWDAIKGGIQRAIDFVRNIMSTVGEIIAAPFRWAADQITSIVDGIKSGFSSAFDFLKGIWNHFADFWNGVELEIPGITMPGPIPNIPGFTLGLPDLPHFAAGGVVTRPTLGLLGESGPEAVVPLDRYGTGTAIVVNITATGLGADAPAIQRAVVEALRGYTRRNGPIPGIAS